MPESRRAKAWFFKRGVVVENRDIYTVINKRIKPRFALCTDRRGLYDGLWDFEAD